MGRRTWVDSEIWYDIRKLTQDEQSLYLHLLLNDDGNVAGYYKLNLRHLATDMDRTEEEILQMLSKDTKYWKYDIETEQVLIPNYTKYNIVRGKPQESKLNATLNKLSPSFLDREFLENWEKINGIGAHLLIDQKFRDRAGIFIN